MKDVAYFRNNSEFPFILELDVSSEEVTKEITFRSCRKEEETGQLPLRPVTVQNCARSRRNTVNVLCSM